MINKRQYAVDRFKSLFNMSKFVLAKLTKLNIILQPRAITVLLKTVLRQRIAILKVHIRALVCTFEFPWGIEIELCS